MTIRVLMTSAFAVLLAAAPASACWDKTDKIIQEIKKADLDTEQLKDVFEYQQEHRDLIVHAHEEGLGCGWHESKTVEFEKAAFGVLTDDQFREVTGRARGEVESLRYENYLLKKELARLELELARLRAELAAER